MKNVVKCLVMAAAVAALSIVSYRAGYEQAIKDREIEAAILSLDNLLSSYEEYREYLVLISDSLEATTKNMENMDSFIEKNTVSFELNKDGVLVVTLNGEEISEDGIMIQSKFEENVKGPLHTEDGRPYFNMLVTTIYSTVSLSEGGLSNAVPGMK